VPLAFEPQIVFGILPVSAPLLLHVEDLNISFVLSRLIHHQSSRHPRSTLLAFRLPRALQNIGGHSIEEADSFRC